VEGRSPEGVPGKSRSDNAALSERGSAEKRAKIEGPFDYAQGRWEVSVWAPPS